MAKYLKRREPVGGALWTHRFPSPIIETSYYYDVRSAPDRLVAEVFDDVEEYTGLPLAVIGIIRSCLIGNSDSTGAAAVDTLDHVGNLEWHVAMADALWLVGHYETRRKVDEVSQKIAGHLDRSLKLIGEISDPQAAASAAASIESHRESGDCRFCR